MVARGDLGSECPVEDLPIIQRDIIERCSYHGRKVIVATQMLESMIENPVPTRAEVTDIFNAVCEQVDCVMLSGETSVGKYPDRCVDVLHRVIRRTEERYPSGRFASDAPLKTNKHKVVKSAVVLANSIPGSKLLVFTKGGVTAHLLAHQRPEFAPIFAFTPKPARQPGPDDRARRVSLRHGVQRHAQQDHRGRAGHPARARPRGRRRPHRHPERRAAR